MSRVLPLACTLALLGLIARDLASLWGRGAAVESVPLFTPASLGSQGQPAPRCSTPPATELDVRLQRIPLPALLAQVPPSHQGAGTVIEEIGRSQQDLRTLRNRRHAWNVEAMELTAALARGIDPGQLAWILDNRDAVAAMPLPAEAWGALGLTAP